MAKYTDAIRDTIIAAFNAGDQPTEAQFTNWITRIQEGIEEHDHDGTGDGDGIAAIGITGITGAGVDVPDDWYIGIGAALERIVFDAAGYISVAGASLGIGTLTPGQNIAGGAADYTGKVVHLKSAGVVRYIAEGSFPLLEMVDLGGGVDDKIMSYFVDGGVAGFLSRNDDLTANIANILVMDLGNGNVGIGVAPSYKLDVQAEVADYIAKFFNDGNNDNRAGVVIKCGADANPAATILRFEDGDGGYIGQVVGDGDGTISYTSASDIRLKNVLGPIDQALAMEALSKVDPIQYVGKGLTAETGRKNIGFSAQSIHKYFPEAAPYDEKIDVYSVAYERLVPVLWAQNKAILKRIEAGGL